MIHPDQDPAGAAPDSGTEPRAEILIPWREILLVAFAYLCLLAVAYSNVFFQGKSLVYTDNFNPFDSRFLAQNYGDKFVPGGVWEKQHLLQSANFHDPGATWWQWEPAAEFLRTAIQSREFPLWDPYTAAGTQALANLTSALFYPPYLPVILAGNTAFLKNCYFLTTLLGTGLFTYLFLRKHALSREASFLGGVVFIFCGALAQNVGSLIGQAAECLPLALFMTRRFLDRPNAARGLTLAAVFAMISLASFPPVLIGLFAFTAVYAVLAVALGASAAGAGHGRLSLIAGFAFACLLGGGMVAFCYVPFLALMHATPQFAKLYHDAALFRLEPASLFQLFSPALMGGEKIFNQPLLTTRWSPELPYVGVASLAIALLAGTVRRRAADVLFWITAGSTIVLVLKLLGVEPIQSIGRLPVLSHVHVAFYFGIFLDFAVAILAALGLDRLLAGQASRARTTAALAVFAVSLFGLYTTAQAAGAESSPIPEVWRVQWRRCLVVAILASAALLLATTLRSPKARRLLGVALILLCSAEGILNTRYPRQRFWDVWKHPVPYVQKLQQIVGLDRCLGAGAMPANGGSAFGIFQLESLMAFNPPRIREAYRRYFTRQHGLFLAGGVALPSEDFLDRANIKFLVAQEGVTKFVEDAEARHYQTEFRDGSVRIFRRQSLPRYFFTSSYTVKPSSSALALMDRELGEREIVLEKSPETPAAANAAEDPAVEVPEFHRNSFSLRLVAPRPGLVYCSESYFPGWTARVNGKPAEILAANYAFRAVSVPRGPVEVDMSYWPRGLTVGLVVTGLSVLTAAGIALAALFRQRRRAPGRG